MKHVHIKALTDGARVAGLVLRTNQQVELDLAPDQIAAVKAAVSAGDIEVSEDGPFSSANDVAIDDPKKNAPKASTPMYGGGHIEKPAVPATDEDLLAEELRLTEAEDAKAKHKGKK